MADKKERLDQTEENETIRPAGETAAESGDNEVCFQQEDVERLLAAIAEKNRLNDELNDRLKRLQADFDNFRRRTRQEKEELSSIVAEGVMLQLLPVLDNFDRALASSANADASSLKSGVEMIHRQLWQILEKVGLEPVKAVGEIFDPQRHEAVMRMEDSDQPDGTIIEEFQKGYAVRNKVIRPSMVKVTTNV